MTSFMPSRICTALTRTKRKSGSAISGLASVAVTVAQSEPASATTSPSANTESGTSA
jgi:hypothetical protein